MNPAVPTLFSGLFIPPLPLILTSARQLFTFTPLHSRSASVFIRRLSKSFSHFSSRLFVFPSPCFYRSLFSSQTFFLLSVSPRPPRQSFLISPPSSLVCFQTDRLNSSQFTPPSPSCSVITASNFWVVTHFSSSWHVLFWSRTETPSVLQLFSVSSVTLNNTQDVMQQARRASRVPKISSS